MHYDAGIFVFSCIFSNKCVCSETYEPKSCNLHGVTRLVFGKKKKPRKIFLSDFFAAL